MTNRTNSGAARHVCTETLYIVVAMVTVNPHQKRLWVHNYWVNSMSIIT